jgi:hypothetical protein
MWSMIVDRYTKYWISKDILFISVELFRPVGMETEFDTSWLDSLDNVHKDS